MNKHFKTCRRCGKNYITPNRYSKICKECHIEPFRRANK